MPREITLTLNEEKEAAMHCALLQAIRGYKKLDGIFKSYPETASDNLWERRIDETVALLALLSEAGKTTTTGE